MWRTFRHGFCRLRWIDFGTRRCAGRCLTSLRCHLLCSTAQHSHHQRENQKTLHSLPFQYRTPRPISGKRQPSHQHEQSSWWCRVTLHYYGHTITYCVTSYAALCRNQSNSTTSILVWGDDQRDLLVKSRSCAAHCSKETPAAILERAALGNLPVCTTRSFASGENRPTTGRHPLYW